MKAILLILLFSIGTTTTTYAVDFTLRNNTAKSIKLKIPGVMNPNLSPMSNSGVGLKVGQEVYFFYNGKKQLLLTVDESLEGKSIIVNKVIKERIAELELKKKRKRKSKE